MSPKKLSDFASLIKGLLTGLAGRQKEVLEKRYGLNKGDSLTLAEIGDSFGITRERVRQIENLALAEVRAKAEANSEYKNTVQALSQNLKNFGGVRREDQMVEDAVSLLASVSPKDVLRNQLHFLFDVSKAAGFHRATNDSHSFWHLNEDARQNAFGFVKVLHDTLKDRKEEVLVHKKFNELFAQAVKTHGAQDKAALNYASVSKKFTKNVFGDFGLADWAEVNPQTSRDWAYLVLKKENKPLHFTEIAEKINQTRAKKQAHPQTVHNELIKDDRFVLVGRGTYGLREFGILPGTAREVITHFLQNHGALASRDLVKLVLQQRQFKENTLLLNLQNRKYFKRLPDGKYTILA